MVIPTRWGWGCQDPQTLYCHVDILLAVLQRTPYRSMSTYSCRTAILAKLGEACGNRLRRSQSSGHSSSPPPPPVRLYEHSTTLMKSIISALLCMPCSLVPFFPLCSLHFLQHQQQQSLVVDVSPSRIRTNYTSLEYNTTRSVYATPVRSPISDPPEFPTAQSLERKQVE